MGLFNRFFRRRKLFAMKPADLEMWQRSRALEITNVCNCFPMEGDPERRQRVAVNFHREEQDTSSEAWGKLGELIEIAASKGAQEFAPGLQMPPELWARIITLPPSISKLKRVRKLYLYGSHLVRIPPEIGDMENLEELDVYTSYRLHWLPYEVTRCNQLKRSRFSTRALYGNYKYRPMFPSLEGREPKNPIPKACSVCRGNLEGAKVEQYWLSLWVGTDVVPLLVNACSEECIRRLPGPAKGYVPHAHKGGVALVQPEPTFARPR